MPRTNWTIPNVVFGGDNVGTPVTHRSQLLLDALQNGRTNVVQVNVDDVAERQVRVWRVLQTGGLDWSTLEWD